MFATSGILCCAGAECELRVPMALGRATLPTSQDGEAAMAKPPCQAARGLSAPDSQGNGTARKLFTNKRKQYSSGLCCMGATFDLAV